MARSGAAVLLLGATFLGAALTGCAAPEAATAPEEEVWVEVGLAVDGFEPIADGDPLELVQGPQGGWHLDLGARFDAPFPDGAPHGEHLVYRIWDPDHTAQVAYPMKVTLGTGTCEPANPGWEQTRIRTVFAIDDPSEVVGRDWLVEAELLAGPEVVVDQRLIVVVDDE
ncbi:MAG: hypothetical protein R3B72_41190 [Polyangiaceae bacterium]